jgi:hypothetical protein
MRLAHPEPLRTAWLPMIMKLRLFAMHALRADQCSRSGAAYTATLAGGEHAQMAWTVQPRRRSPSP